MKQNQDEIGLPEKGSASNMQYGGVHYLRMKIQPWDYILANEIGFMEGCVISYVSRWRFKGGVLDLLKARHHLDRLIQHAQEQNETGGQMALPKGESKNVPSQSREQGRGIATERVHSRFGTTGQSGEIAGPDDGLFIRVVAEAAGPGQAEDEEEVHG
jgi:hypothetical protein